MTNIDRLLMEAGSHIAQMAPHQRERKTAQLLIKVVEELDKCNIALDRIADYSDNWESDEDAADGMIAIARKALNE